MLRFSVAAAQLLADPIQFKARAQGPLLLWETGPRPTDEPQWATDPGLGRARPSVTDPLLIEIRKRGHLSNGFGLGITVGRTANNDIPLDDPTISRFHAFFRRDKTGLWMVVDVESQNGTFLSDARLTPGKPAPLFEHASLRFGDVPVTFFAIGAFERYVLERRRAMGTLRG